MSITPLPAAPQPTDSTAEFNTKSFAWVAALENFVTEANALAAAVELDSDAASIAANDAVSAAAAAVAAANATKWVSGTTYAEGNVAWSPLNYLSYRRKSTGGGTSDPSIDSTNWAQVAGTGNVTTDAVQTLTNKTLTNPLITGGFEYKAVIAAGQIDVKSANYFTKTIAAATTFSLVNVPASGTVASFVLKITNGGSQTITWWSGIKWAGGTVPTLTASGRDDLGFYTDDGGATWTGLLLGKDIK